MIKDSKITLLITGSIAAYKSAELLRQLQKQGASVQVAMSRSACEFISPLTMQTLSGSVVTTDLFDADREAEIDHIALADEADVLLVAPATADIIAKAACGIADDTISTILLASTSKIIFAPAMNVNMWQNPVTQENVDKLKKRGVIFIEPGVGELACGWVGAGRFPELETITETVSSVLAKKTLKGVRVIVTAGPTIESIDPIRYVSNRSTGKMGYALAKAAAWAGAEVHLISGPTSLDAPSGMKFTSVETAEEMKEAVFAAVNKKGSDDISKQYVCMAAAVTDHKPANASSEKIKSPKSESYSIEMQPCPDILSELGNARSDIETSSKLEVVLVGFCAETCDEKKLEELASEKMKRKKADMMIANLAADSFGKDTNTVLIVDKNNQTQKIEKASKQKIASQIVGLLHINS